ncbi:DUF6265 family protein [Stenotrophomonas mori]|uniref:DUF6265 family protein n=1 Tax=Stenotrophomonas mori TaxID=2871096 RepID=A0ABT0SF01_9GAMM|nr:DUF6265 family protein [Stenotrophomonas mori]MCL7713891.1 DUF6265 family protein [Stenotrophomonas mori]
MRDTGIVLGAGLALAAGTATAAADGFDWLAGHWCGGSAERTIEEVWLPAAGGTLLGMSRTLGGDTLASFEFMRLVASGEDAGLHVQPDGAPPTTFAIAGHGDGWVVFAQAAHDFPDRIEYRRDGALLHAAISGPGDAGAPLRIPFEYRRCGD